MIYSLNETFEQVVQVYEWFIDMKYSQSFKLRIAVLFLSILCFLLRSIVITCDVVSKILTSLFLTVITSYVQYGSSAKLFVCKFDVTEFVKWVFKNLLMLTLYMLRLHAQLFTSSISISPNLSLGLFWTRQCDVNFQKLLTTWSERREIIFRETIPIITLMKLSVSEFRYLTNEKFFVWTALQRQVTEIF